MTDKEVSSRVELDILDDQRRKALEVYPYK